MGSEEEADLVAVEAEEVTSDNKISDHLLLSFHTVYSYINAKTNLSSNVQTWQDSPSSIEEFISKIKPKSVLLIKFLVPSALSIAALNQLKVSTPHPSRLIKPFTWTQKICWVLIDYSKKVNPPQEDPDQEGSEEHQEEDSEDNEVDSVEDKEAVSEEDKEEGSELQEEEEEDSAPQEEDSEEDDQSIYKHILYFTLKIVYLLL